MATQQATINVRMDSALKERAGAVLESYGISTTQAITRLWEEMAQSPAIPDFISGADKSARAAEVHRKLDVLKSMAGCVKAHTPPPASSKELRSTMYDDKYRDYLELQ